MKTKKISYLLLLFVCVATMVSCREGVGCPADQNNDWKKIEAARKQQLKNPNNPNKGKNKKGPNVVGNGVVPK